MSYTLLPPVTGLGLFGGISHRHWCIHSGCTDPGEQLYGCKLLIDWESPTAEAIWVSQADQTMDSGAQVSYWPCADVMFGYLLPTPEPLNGLFLLLVIPTYHSPPRPPSPPFPRILALMATAHTPSSRLWPAALRWDSAPITLGVSWIVFGRWCQEFPHS